MDRPPPSLPNSVSHLIAMAAQLVGSADAVRAEMGSSAEDFAAYCVALKQPSGPEYDALFALVIREQRRLIVGNRALFAKIRAQHDKGS